MHPQCRQVPDFQVSRTFLRFVVSFLVPAVVFCKTESGALRYHLLHPEYIYNRISKFGQSYTLRILLIMCDIVSNLSVILWLSIDSKSVYV